MPVKTVPAFLLKHKQHRSGHCGHDGQQQQRDILFSTCDTVFIRLWDVSTLQSRFLLFPLLAPSHKLTAWYLCVYVKESHRQWIDSSCVCVEREQSMEKKSFPLSCSSLPFFCFFHCSTNTHTHTHTHTLCVCKRTRARTH